MTNVFQSLFLRQIRVHWRNRVPMLLTPMLLCLLVIGGGTPTALAASAQRESNPSARVSVQANSSLGVIPNTAVGINAAAWDSHLLDASVPGLMRKDGVKVVRYPGGSTSDYYHWQSNTVETCSICGTVNASDTFDAFMGVVQKVGAQAMITVNYGSGTPQEAAGWVQYANKGGPGYNGPVPTYPGGSPTGHTYGIKYWEVGNEVYGNGTYGSTWEYDTHSLGPATYATNVVAFSQAMKAVDPSIKIGLVVTAPGNWPDGQTSPSSPQPWNNTVLPIACSSIDFVIPHWYTQGPGGESDAGLLAAPQNGETTSVSSTPSIPSMVSTLRSEINQYCGSHASSVQIMATETNSVSYNPGKQTVSLVNALFLDENYMTWLENGVTNVDWWDLHNGIVTGTNDSSSLYGTADYGDYGVLSSGDSSNGISEPPANTPFPDYYGLQMLTRLWYGGGNTMVSASSNQSLVTAFAVKHPDGQLSVLLINTDPNNSYNVSFSFSGFTPLPITLTFFYGENSSSISTKIGGIPKVLPPYSLTSILFTPTFARK